MPVISTVRRNAIAYCVARKGYGTSTASEWQIYTASGERKYLIASERDRFLKVADASKVEDKALCWVLAYTGCRISEALALQRSQIDAESSVIVFRTLKQRTPTFRAVPVPASLIELVLRLPIHGDGRLWQMHRVTAWRHIKQVMQAAQINGAQASCKGLRHSFGIMGCMRHVPPNLIQKWLGHQSAETTSIYLNALGPEEHNIAARIWE